MSKIDEESCTKRYIALLEAAVKIYYERLKETKQELKRVLELSNKK